MTNLLEIIWAAKHQVDELKHPNIETFIDTVDPILSELGQVTIGRDTVESIYVSDEYVEITTSYYCRGCSNTNMSLIPMNVIEAEDPMKAAKERTLRKKLAEAIHELNVARNRVARFETLSQEIALELAEFLKK